MRDVQYIIIHCSATPEGRNVTVEDVRRWHTIDNGWSDIGYHWYIEIDGTLQQGRKEYRNGAHARGYNSKSVGVCYAGGVEGRLPKDTRTDAQKETLRCLLIDLKLRYPKAIIIGHRDISDKSCPSFDAKSEYLKLETE